MNTKNNAQNGSELTLRRGMELSSLIGGGGGNCRDETATRIL